MARIRASGVPAAHACGLHAVGYGHREERSRPAKPANASGSR